MNELAEHGFALVSCPRPYFSGIGSGNIAFIVLFQRNSIIATSVCNASLMFHNHVKTAVYIIIIILCMT